MQAVIFTSREFEFPSKKTFARATGLDKVVRIFEKFQKKRGGHCAFGSPRAGSVFALVQRRSLLSLKRCRK
jgi:hypothetical protein